MLCSAVPGLCPVPIRLLLKMGELPDAMAGYAPYLGGMQLFPDKTHIPVVRFFSRWQPLLAVSVLVVYVMTSVLTISPLAAASTGTWSAPLDPHQNNIYPESPSFAGMSCVSSTWCMAVDSSGDAVFYNGTAWTNPSSNHVDTEVNGNGTWAMDISCPTTTFCIVVDSLGYATEYSSGTWGKPTLIDGQGSANQGQNAVSLESVSCPSTNFCAAVDANGYAMTYDGSTWTVPTFVDNTSTTSKTLVSVSCASSTMCIATDGIGDVASYDGSTWSALDPIDTGEIESVSCPTPSFCVAVDWIGQALTFNGTTWSSPTTVVPQNEEELKDVSCASTKFCVASASSVHGTYFGDVFYFDGTSWSTAVSVDTNGNLVAISCPSISFCAAGDDSTTGYLFVYTNADTVPGAPTNVIATPADATANLSWTAPTSQGECPITSYEVDTYSGTTLVNSEQTGSTSTTYTVSGLSNGTKYTFMVAATNCDGNGPASLASQPVIPSQPTTPAPYNPLTPYRICDTRAGNPSGLSGQNAQCAGKTLVGGTPLTIQVAGTDPNGQSSGGVPSTGATAAVLNVTADDASAAGFFTIYPSGTAEPLSSNLNFKAGEAVPNLVEVALGQSGQVSIYTNITSADVIVDVEGYVGPATSGAGLFNALPPARICDTRAGNPSGLSGTEAQCNADGALSAGGTMTIQVAGVGGVPSSGVAGVVLNVTVSGTTASSFLTVWPQGSPRPTASNLNWTKGVTIPNRVSVPVGPTGQVSIYNNSGQANVIVDVGGWYTLPGGTGTTLTQFSGITPARILDTRQGSGEPYEGQTIPPGGSLTIQVQGVGGVPTGATAAVLNVTVTHTTAASYLTIWPAGQSRPTASDLNWALGETVPNLVIVKIGSSGQVSIFNNAGSVDVIADVVGWYQ